MVPKEQLNGQPPQLGGKICEGFLCESFVFEGKLEATANANVTYLKFAGTWYRLYFDLGLIFWREAASDPNEWSVPVETLRREHAGELPVGGAVVVPTHHSDIPYLVSAPTMRVPGNIADTVNVYLAFRAALLTIKASEGIETLLSPALGTGVGSMPLERAARQMYAAYAEVILGEAQWRSSARGILQHHARLLA